MRKAPKRPQALARYPAAAWDGADRVWRDGPFWYDARAADAAVAFFTDHLVLTEGEWAGQPFLLQPWQEHDIVRPLFGWKREDGTRRYRRAFVWIARKNGKTELAAGIALLMLLGDAEPGGQVFSIAREKPQATIVFSKAVAMVERSRALPLPAAAGGAGLECYTESIYWPQENASFRPLSGKPKGKHGLNMSGLIGDEVHEWPDGDLYQFVHDSAAARRQPLEFIISTAGEKGTHGEVVFSECKAILDGDVEDPETLVLIYAPDPDDDWTQLETWKKGNPNWGVSVKEEGFRAEFRAAQQLPRLENNFKRYRLNLWTEQDALWLPIDSRDDEGRPFGWDHCVGPRTWRELETDLKGKRFFGGLDLSATQDLSAWILWFPVQDGLDVPAVLARFWKPRDLIKAHSKRDKLPYDRWAAEGALYTTPGNVIDHEAIRAQVIADCEVFQVAFRDGDREAGEGGIALDRFDATETAVKLSGEGLPVVLFGQGFVSMNAPAKELERLVLSNGFHHGGHPVLRQHAKSAAYEEDAAGNIKPSKDKSTKRIDGIAGLCMARGIAAKDRPVERSYLESDDVLVF